MSRTLCERHQPRIGRSDRRSPVSAVKVGGLGDIKLPWLVCLRLRRIGKDQRTGVLLYGLIRTSPEKHFEMGARDLRP